MRAKCMDPCHVSSILNVEMFFTGGPKKIEKQTQQQSVIICRLTSPLLISREVIGLTPNKKSCWKEIVEQLRWMILGRSTSILRLDSIISLSPCVGMRIDMISAFLGM